MGTAKTTSKVFDKGPLSTASSFFQEVDEDHVAETSWPKIAYIIVANFLGFPIKSETLHFRSLAIPLMTLYLSG